MHSLFAAVYVLIFMNLDFMKDIESQSVFGYFTYKPDWTWFNYFLDSAKSMSSALILLVLMGVLSFFVKSNLTAKGEVITRKI